MDYSFAQPSVINKSLLCGVLDLQFQNRLIATDFPDTLSQIAERSYLDLWTNTSIYTKILFKVITPRREIN